MPDPMPTEEQFLLRSIRRATRMSRSRKAIALVIGLCACGLLFWAYHPARRSGARPDPPPPPAGPQTAPARKPLAEAGARTADAGDKTALAVPPETPTGRTDPPPRLLWEIKTAGGMDAFSAIHPAGDRLVGMRRGVLYALDARTGATCWRYPSAGTASEPHGPNEGLWADVLLAVRGERVILLAPTKDMAAGGPTLIEVSLRDGQLTRPYRHGLTLAEPHELRFMCWHPRPTGRFYPLWNSVEASIVDLDLWRESARFKPDGHVYDFKQTCGSVLYATARRPNEPFARAVTVDLDRGTMCSVPMRGRNRDFLVLPDGTFLLDSARFNAACGFMGMWPYPMPVCVGGDVYVRDARGLCRVDLRDASIAWRCPIPWPHSLWSDRSDGLIAAGGGIVAMLERGSLCLVDAATGGLRAAIRTAGRRLACDGSRVYVAELTGLRAYATHPVDPARPDPADLGDPACYLARCRAALLAGDFDGALPAIRGIGVAAGLRKETRDEAASILSQLARSPAAVRHPELWQEVMLDDGWAAGELYAEEYSRLRRPSSLLAIGTRRSLASAAAMLDDPGLWGDMGEEVFLAAEAARVLTGVRPVEKLLNGPEHRIQIAFRVPLEEDAFTQALSRLRGHSHGGGKYLIDIHGHGMSPAQVRQLAEVDSPNWKAAKAQMESMARGTGTVEKIVITRPAQAPAPDRDSF